YSTVSTPMADLSVVLMIVIQSIVILPRSADPLAAAQDALRPDEEHDDEYGQRADALELRRHPQGGDLDEQAHHQRADQRAERRAEPAERHTGEDEQQDVL